VRLANKPARGDASDSNRNPVAPDPNRADFNTKATAPDVSDKRIRVLGNNNVMKFGRHNLSLFCQSYHRVAHWRVQPPLENHSGPLGKHVKSDGVAYQRGRPLPASRCRTATPRLGPL
jgi:hypothetical protein